MDRIELTNVNKNYGKRQIQLPLKRHLFILEVVEMRTSYCHQSKR